MRPTATMLSFRLSKAARLVLIVRGPGPGCELAGRVPILGRRGLNLVPFDGTIRNRPLDPGTYLLATRERGGKTDLAETYVTIVAPGSPKRVGMRPKCSQRRSLELTAYNFANPLVDFPGAGFFEPDDGSQRDDGSSDDAGAVLGEQTPLASGLPDLPQITAPSEDGFGEDGFGEFLLRAALFGSLLVIAVLLAAGARSRARSRSSF